MPTPSSASREHPDALITAASAANYANRHLIVQFVAKNRLPAIYGGRDTVDVGGSFHMVTTAKTVSDEQRVTSIGF